MNGSKRVLLVEDDKDDQYIFVEAMSGIQNASLYDIANNGKEALDMLESAAFLPDLIFMDLNMPVMDGMECLAEIVKNPQTTNIPVVILSGDISKAEHIRKAWGKPFITKSGNTDALRRKLELAINLDYCF